MIDDDVAGSGERERDDAYLVSSLVHVASGVVVHPQHGDQPVGHPVGLNNSQHKVRFTHIPHISVRTTASTKSISHISV